MTGELKKAINSDVAILNIWNDIKLAGYIGSTAHGTAGDIIDDVDIMGVFVSPISHYFGLTRLEHIMRTDIKDHDFALFEIQKYFRLLLKSNPNVLSLLWLPDNMYIVKEGWGKLLLENRSIFISKQLYKTFGGYAFGQLQRMTRLCSKQAYQGAERRKRFEKFGYDCKNAAHLIRLLRMGIEALTTGEINVYRHDSKILKEIKSGGWTLEAVEKEAGRLNKLLDEAFVRCSLPDRPDLKKAEKLLVDILEKETRKV